MLNLFSINNPNRIAVRIAAFVRNHDPIRAWAFGKLAREQFPTAPYWIVLLYDDFVTAVVRDMYERGIVAAFQEIREGYYNPTLGSIFMQFAETLNPIYRGLKYDFEWREEQRQRDAKEAADDDTRLEALRNEPPTLDELLFRLWFSLETDEHRVKFLHSASEIATHELNAMTREACGDFDLQVWRAADNSSDDLQKAA